MVFASTQHRATSDIYFKRVDGRTITQLTADPAHDVMPAISPDGSASRSARTGGNWDIFVMSISGGQAVQITSEQSHELHLTLVPDGRKIAFCRLGETSGPLELWVTDADGSTTNEFIGYGLFPQWCPVAATGEKGRDKILFRRSRAAAIRPSASGRSTTKPGDTSGPTEIVSRPRRQPSTRAGARTAVDRVCHRRTRTVLRLIPRPDAAARTPISGSPASTAPGASPSRRGAT